MIHYRIYFLAQDGKIDGMPVELVAESHSDVIMRALMAERNIHGAEVWCGATLVRRVAQSPPSTAFVRQAEAGREAVRY